MVDDLLFFSQDPDMITETLNEIHQYELKGAGVPEYYSGSSVECDTKRQFWKMSANTYINTV